MLHTFWSVKGGVGVTVVAAASAVAASSRGPVTIIDLRGDQPALLGTPTAETAPGLFDWFARPEHPVDALDRLLVVVTDGLTLLPRGAASSIECPERTDDLVAWARERRGTVVVDAGVSTTTGTDPNVDEVVRVLASAGRSWLVTRSCYLSLRRASSLDHRGDGAVLIDEPGRALGRREVESVLGVHVVARVEHDPSVARIVDNGTLLRRRPRNLLRAVSRLQ